MADERISNGVSFDAENNQTVENFYDLDQRTDNEVRDSGLTKKIESLELEKLQLVHENAKVKERVEKLTAEVEELQNNNALMKEKLEGMEKEIEQSEEAKKALDAIAARALELETEVSRLQHDLISTMSEGEEANKELVELKRILGDKGVRIENLEREVESLKKEKVESERKVRELERKVGVLEVREIEEKSKKVRIEEEMREKIAEKEREIGGFRKKVEDLESVISEKRFELEKWTTEKLDLKALSRESEEKAKLMELKVVGLQKEMEEAEKVIAGLKEKAVDTVNGSLNGIRESVISGEKKGLNLDWPVVVGATGAIAVAAAVTYVIYGRRR
ncbi:peroxisomal and mitochondrial division factor 2 [Juglans microcarpa x Juglans regia]|uniref:peroxisomal and mitochondrial division factor 2 n=1 Tax=Juglans microcarpa x Juglans regia TaxID=2249226 RepID=UPI001B7E4260|nr:peroxisomal and mitochondrial division factor 2 [Juglans microcarpa x Juglans regia]XP_041005474.1 peroxisomal and mitochondrial division factor 2 [Juglans microcarpa x Juglans regia]XP_041005475.1 peroxisomal and mitochondrial division factor 2 [Juglans microcarpa x Juglans regia]XP_041005476.1 peroxisomal and mitochondrial division factor 2 [Juglans microcarpa x Juglans regia]XP_041005477.1 peroxisomal and mitochondrial division factor 2 [Juglans microcarpa x Juglans regia]XP_041005478.1 